MGDTKLRNEEDFDLIFLSLLCGLGGIMFYHSLSVNEGVIYREQVLGTYKSPIQKIKGYYLFFINKVLLNDNVTKRLEIVKTSKKAYVQRILMGLGFSVMIGIELNSIGLFLGGILFTWAWSTVSLSNKVKHWRENILMEIPTLVRMFKIRFAVFDTVANAVTNVADSLSGPLEKEWAVMVRELENKIPLETALDNLSKRTEVRELTSVVNRLKSYYHMGLPDVPFGDMDNMLVQIQAIQRRAQIKRMTTPLMFYTGAGFLTLVAPIIVAVLISMFHSMLSGVII